ncbi:MAG: carbon monoxide dehydrogenase subunit G [Burkholderiaceae bacterium]|nr:carbon monoxide dehydrogenase subunit G [Burkholderiaceae bacterium]
MKLQGERLLPAPVDRTWVALNDPGTLKACIAGCQSLDKTSDTQFVATMAVRIGPVNAKFKGNLELTDIVPMKSYTINFNGQGGVAGFGKGSAQVALSPQDGGTLLNYVADAQVGGKLAQIGSRLVDAAAAKIAEDFFKAFEAQVGKAAPAAEPSEAEVAAPPPPTAAAEGPPPAVPAPVPVPQEPSGGSKPWLWVAVAIVIALLIYYFR